MNEKEADQIIDFLYGMLRPPDQEGTRRAWRIQLVSLDANVASQACINGMQVWEWFPKWSQFVQEYKALTKKADTAPTVECKTCNDDKFVVVALRQVVQSDWMERHGLTPVEDGFIEELAPCPQCSHGVDTVFRRFDGTLVECPDPARVRQLLQK